MPSLNRIVLVFFCLLLAAPFPCPAQPASVPSEPVEARRHALDEQASLIAKLNGDVERLRAAIAELRGDGGDKEIGAARLEEARTAQEAAEIELQSIELDQLASERTGRELAEAVEQLERKLKELRALSAPNAEQRQLLEKTVHALDSKRALLELETQQETLLDKKAALIKDKLQLSREYRALMNDRYETALTARREEALVEMELRVKQEQQRLLALSTRLNEQLGVLPENGPDSPVERNLLQTQIKEAEESAYLLQTQLQAEKAAYTLRQSEKRLENPELDADRLATLLTETEKLAGELNSADSLTQGKLAVLQQTLEVLQKRQAAAPGQLKILKEQQIVARLADQFARQVSALQKTMRQADATLDRARAAHEASVKRGLTARHTLPADLTEWKEIFRELIELPATLGQFARNTAEEIAAGLRHATPLSWGGALLALATWLAVWLPLHRLSAQLPQLRYADAASFSAKTLLLALDLFRENRFALLTGALLPAAWLLDVKTDALLALALVFALWFGARVPQILAKQLLLSARVRRAEWKATLYRILFWFILLSALLAFFMILGEAGILSGELHELTERTFMLLLASSFAAMLRIRPRVMDRLEQALFSRRWLNVTSVSSFLFLFSMFAASLLGVVGYVNLAWTVAAHLAWLLLVIMGWYLAQGFLRDMVKSLSSTVTSRFYTGHYWVQDIIEPLHQAARLLLILGAALLLLRIYDWQNAPALQETLDAWLHTPLFNLGEQAFDAWRLIGAGLFLAILIWLTRWVRKFSFRWLYARVVDIGVRNSLAAFTQYSVFLVGVLIALKKLGLDLTSLAIFTGAVGVGIGFGMQNIANNFISGIILLLERPLRARDLVTIGTIEGEVKDIGIRSVTVKTAENQEVIIPNADIISRPLVNWTRNDRVLRTVFHLLVDYRANPHEVRSILLETVQANPSVLAEPAPNVWLSEFTPAGIDFQVQYFINTEQAGRLEIKSRLLLALWDALQEADIALAHQPDEIYRRGLATIKEM
ncbi:MAG TPA: mechanosensitive ion channel domain-containing protein [Methylococcaceae bacterium]|nr:mechanosensitive ion channel domain-containing protein [Methylococcaceae bacterium]